MNNPPIADEALKTTPLHALQVALGGKMVPFAGYEMAVNFPLGVLGEHKHPRAAAGLFDVSHMGQVRLHGPGRAEALESLLPADVAKAGVFALDQEDHVLIPRVMALAADQVV